MARGKARIPFITRAAVKRLAVLAVLLAALGFGGWRMMIRMPGESYRGPLEPPTDEEARLAETLRRDVERLAGGIGPRNVHRREAYTAAADFIEGELRAAGYDVRRQAYEVEGQTCHNIDVEIRGNAAPDEIVVVGAHYDSVDVDRCPGANDNGTGVAAVLALARALAGRALARTVRLAAFANEEPPYFQTEEMGSLVYARACRERGENVVAMASVETIGYYSDAEGSQSYPPPMSLFYPSRGDFVAFVGNVSSRALVRRAIEAFRGRVRFPSEGACLPGFIPGVGWSDHWAFWQAGYPAFMVTDTAPFRYPHYHTSADTPNQIDYARMARVVVGLGAVVEALATP